MCAIRSSLSPLERFPDGERRSRRGTYGERDGPRCCIGGGQAGLRPHGTSTGLGKPYWTIGFSGTTDSGTAASWERLALAVGKASSQFMNIDEGGSCRPTMNWASAHSAPAMCQIRTSSLQACQSLPIRGEI